MARSITFNGQTLFHPGGISRVNATSLTPIGETQTGVLGLIGESDAGQDGVATVINDPALADSIFGSGPLADAIRIAFDPSNDPRVPGGAFQVIAYKTNHGTQSTAALPDSTALVTDTAGSGSTTTVINGTTTATLNQYAGRWLKIGTEQRQIVSNTAGATPAYTVSPGFSVAPAAATSLLILNNSILLTSLGFGQAQNLLSVEFEPGIDANTFVITLDLQGIVNQSPELGGNPFLIVEYVGGAIPTHGTGVITGATTSVVTFTPSGGAPTLNAFAGMVLQLADGTQRLITSNTSTSPCDITIDSGQLLTTAEATAIVGTTLNVRNVTAATMSITGSNGKATGATSSVSPTADNLNYTFPAGQTLRQFVAFLNGSTNYRASIPAGVNPDTTLMSSFDFGTRATGVDVRFDQGVLPATNGNFRRDLQQAVDWINSFSTLASAVRASAGTTDGAEIPAFTGGSFAIPQDVAIFFTGGIRGTSNNTDWQNAFDAMLEVRVNDIVPLISYDLVEDGFGSTATFASVAAQLSEHVTQARGIAKTERGGAIGMHGTKTQLLNQAAVLNNTDVQLTGQKLTVLNAAGTLTEQPEWSSAVDALGMRCGMPEVGEPLTFKYISTAALSQDPSWNPKDVTDVNALIQGGILFAETVVGKGFRWVRDITTYLIDDNEAFLSGSTRDAVRFVVYDLRTFLEDEFTGLKAKPATVAAIRELTAAKLVTYVEQNILIPSLDPETQTTTVPGWRNLRVMIDGNVATIRVEIFPVVGITFEITDLFLQLPILAG